MIDRYLGRDQTTIYSRGDHDEGFAFFYCSRDDTTRRSFRYILRSYIRQLSEIPRRPESIHEASYTLYKKKAQIQNDISMKECEMTLIRMINSYPRTTLVLDALDECEQATKKQITDLFKYLVQTSSRPLKVFMASRIQDDIEDSFSSFDGPQMLISISTADNRADIEKFVATKIYNAPI